MSSGSDPPDIFSPNQSNNLVPSGKADSSELILPMSIERECIDLLNEQLEILRFSARVNQFETQIDEAGNVRVYQFIQVLKQNEAAKRFLIDIIRLDLSSYREYEKDTLIVICNAFISQFGNDIYIYLIYVERPSLLYEITIRKQVKNFRSKGIKFIARRDVCDFRRVLDLGFHSNYLQEIKDHLNDLLDLNKAQQESKISSQEIPNRIQKLSNPREMDLSERRRLIKIIQEMPCFSTADDCRATINFIGVKVIDNFPYNGQRMTVASMLVDATFDSLSEFTVLLEGLLETGDITKGGDKSFLEELKDSLFKEIVTMPKLEISEKRRLIQILSKTYDFAEGGARGRRIFIQQTAGLGQFITGSFELSSPPRTVAGDLIGRIEEFGYLTDRQAYHSLGALLDAILSLDDELIPEDSQFVASLIVRYSLVTDLSYIEKLRHKYNLTEQVVCEPPPNDNLLLFPLSTDEQVNSAPQFDVKIEHEEKLESIINSADNFLDFHLFEGALYCAQAVARIEIPEGTPRGTGFLVGTDLLLTNQHVLKEQDYLEEAVARFGFTSDASGVTSKGIAIKMQPGFYHVSPADQLDYALIRLQEAPIKNVATDKDLKEKTMAELFRAGKHQGYLVLAGRKLLENSRVNIIQHPGGQALKVVLTQNYIASTTERRVQYIADTDDGSSGSPVFNQRWEVVGLHHSSNPYPAEPLSESLKKALRGRFNVNEGIPMRAILEDFKKQGIDRYLPRQ